MTMFRDLLTKARILALFKGQRPVCLTGAAALERAD